MTDVHSADPGAEPPIEVIKAPEGTPESLTLSEAARVLSKHRAEKRKAEQPAPAAPEPAAADQPESTAQADDATPPQEATGETQAADPVEEPPLELPRSWTKDRNETWAKLDRATQEMLLEHDRKASAEIRRSQNEAAEQRKAAEAERQAAIAEKTQYQQGLAQLHQALEQQQLGQFADIKTEADALNLSATDPIRYLQYRAHKDALAAVETKQKEAQEAQFREFSKQWTDFAKREDDLFSEKAPEMKDKAQAEKLAKGTLEALKDVGFTDQEINANWNSPMFRDHRVQLLLRDAYRYREIQAKGKNIPANRQPPPPVQRPGVTQGKNAAKDAELASLTKQLDTAKGLNAVRIAARIHKLGTSP